MFCIQASILYIYVSIFVCIGVPAKFQFNCVVSGYLFLFGRHTLQCCLQIFATTQAMESGPSRSSSSHKRPVRTQAVIDQSDMYTHVLSAFTERKVH